MTTVDSPETRTTAFDLDLMDADARWALQIRLDLPARDDVVLRIVRLTGMLAEVVESGVIDKADPTLGRLFAEANRLMTPQVRPDQMTHTDAYEHLRKLGNNARAFAAIYRLRNNRAIKEKKR